MNIVMIDSGLSLEDGEIPHLKNVSGISIEKANDAYMFSDDYQDRIGHGTILANLLLEYISVDINLFVIKIIDSTLTIDIDSLIEALQYCYEYLDCDLIQISLGTLYSDSRLKNILKKITDKGTAIVAAFDNENCISYPAAYENVIGVDVRNDYHSIEQYNIIKTNIIDLQGANIVYRVRGLRGKRLIVKGSSFLCSYVTSMIANLKLENFHKDTCIEALQRNAKEIYNTNKLQNRKQLIIRKAIIFPFNKEIHSLAAFEHLLGFEVIDYCDFRQKGLLNRKINTIIPYTTNEKAIHDFERIDWTMDFDTFICGHVGELSKILGYDVRTMIMEKCNQYSKQLICFDNITEYRNQYPDLCMWFPNTNESMVPPYRFGKLRSPNVPIIGVFGTSSKQGKMTVQLYLREALKRKGIKVKSIGSEPESVLFGFEDAYVFGYESTDVLSPYEMVQALNEAVYSLEEEDCELIIAGSQSGTVPHQLRSLDMIPWKQYLFLLGTQPDGIILCVNGYDSEEYIKRTMTFFKSSVNANVICLIVSYVNAKRTDVAVKPISFFQENFGVPAFDLQSLQIEQIIDVIFTYYGR